MTTAIAKMVVDQALDQYMIIMKKKSDDRVSDWPLMESPIPTLVMLVTYLYFTVILGPKFMENRKPFRLNNILVIYNGCQVLFSAYMLYEVYFLKSDQVPYSTNNFYDAGKHLLSGWYSDYSYKCQPVDYSRNPKALRMARLCWLYYISKLTEFLDTIFFVLRKKNNQISFLHLYHHSLTPIETWCCVKFLAGGHGTFSNVVNNIVHIIMYSYYMVSAMGPEFQKFLWWKKYLTTIQLSQFVIVFVHSAQVLYYNCGYPRFIALFLLLHSTIFFILFGNFYIQAYQLKKKSSTKAQ